VSFKLRSAEGLNFAVPINDVIGLLKAPNKPISLRQMRKNLIPHRMSESKAHLAGDVRLA